MKNKESWQLEAESAKFYEHYFVPALFAQWAPRTVNAAHIKPGDRVLDVACGTGLVARFAENKTNRMGSVTGYDLNPGMLAVAASISPQIEWMLGPAEKMPFQSESFDAVTCQFGLMFFQDQEAALREMYRVLKPDGKMVITVWDTLDNIPMYAALVELMAETCGEKAADVLRALFVLGDTNALKSIFQDAGIPKPHIQTVDGIVKFTSIEDWLEVEVAASPLKALVGKDQLNKLKISATKKLSACLTPGGTVRFSAPAHIATVRKE